MVCHWHLSILCQLEQVQDKNLGSLILCLSATDRFLLCGKICLLLIPSIVQVFALGAKQNKVNPNEKVTQWLVQVKTTLLEQRLGFYRIVDSSFIMATGRGLLEVSKWSPASKYCMKPPGGRKHLDVLSPGRGQQASPQTSPVLQFLHMLTFLSLPRASHLPSQPWQGTSDHLLTCTAYLDYGVQQPNSSTWNSAWLRASAMYWLNKWVRSNGTASWILVCKSVSHPGVRGPSFRALVRGWQVRYMHVAGVGCGPAFIKSVLSMVLATPCEHPPLIFPQTYGEIFERQEHCDSESL